jgi:hypothetical protein
MGNGERAGRVIRLAPWLAICALAVAVLIIVIGSLAFGNDETDVFAHIGQIGDVTGGITGPILNFLGMLIVYYSLREQLRANNIQNKAIRDEIIRANAEVALKSTEHLIISASEALVTFKEQLSLVHRMIISFDKDMLDANEEMNADAPDEHIKLLEIRDGDLIMLSALVSMAYNRVLSKEIQEEYRVYLFNMFYVRCVSSLPFEYVHNPDTYFKREYAPYFHRLVDINMSFLGTNGKIYLEAVSQSLPKN